MSILRKFKPEFWDAVTETGPYKGLFNYRRMWRLVVLVLAVVALVPLIIMTLIDYNVTRHSLNQENILLTSRTTSNTRRSLEHFLTQHKSAMELVVQRETVESLHDPAQLAKVLHALKTSFGGFVDLGLINDTGRQIAYVGPYELQGMDYSGQEWLGLTLARGSYLSDVFLGFRDEPHLIVAVKFPDKSKGRQHVLRATLDTEQFNEMLSSIDLSGKGDAFLVNRAGVLQTPSRWHGNVLSKVDLSIPAYASNTRVLQSHEQDGTAVTVGYAYITNSPFILLVVKRTKELMKPWGTIRLELLWMLVVSIAVILLVIAAVASYMTNKVHLADQTRAATLHQMEHTNRMASIGRLAAGVAHEINNPLAIINEKAGLIKDLFLFRNEYAQDKRLLANIDSILASVERCGTITRRLLGFARHVDVKIEQIKFARLAEDVVGFLHKEAEYRSIDIQMDIPEDLPEFESDRGKQQQIFLNLINNAFQAMNDGGRLSIVARRKDDHHLTFIVSDDGCGIPKADIKRIFEPFFSTKQKRGGTGLGLSITYGLVEELGGTMNVDSEVGKGTTFTITFPLRVTTKESNQ
ncbi:sensor histidine kinase [Pseudodesulfovibrio tunisiensis]|uniref:sensor histidine kinase n=1 Tax=Pseudodesulfovibrio tunisiensis TaxID=463192 RepID=UPI001FB48AA6|nr:PAS domain-containing sensor histidine kinase [Pseudodesulfovibrio tunisiensis]